TLLLLRHAKSSWDSMSLADYDRPLAKRGRKAAPSMGAEIARLGLQPDLILCSGATRTRETLDLVLPALGSPMPEIVYDDAIYMATPSALMGLLRKLPAGGSAPKTVLVVGHNPGLEELSELLVGGGNDDAQELMAEKFPTGALAVFTFPGDAWSDIALGAGTLAHFITPARVT
ncbi:MAG: histidine phosphatase family protein, partial [Hyphomicrobium sp.]|nr:histidine phosphatase family protein [Hyphomicrobium sp.]